MLSAVPRVVWFHWMQGREAMPPVVRGCLASWTALNPDWDVRFVDAGTVWDYLDRDAIPVESLLETSPQVYANGIRLGLLEAYGGVWADATTCCRTPLSDWITAMPGDFFAFADPGPDRLLSNWFLASTKGAYLVERMAAEYLGIFRRSGPLTRIPDAAVGEVLERSADTDVFVEPVLTGRSRRYPYYLFHYLFAFLYRRDDRFRRGWDAAGRVGADPSHAAQRLNLLAAIDDVARERLRAENPHLHKLVWRIDRIDPGTVLDAVLSAAV